MIPRLLLLLFAFYWAIVANGQENIKRYSEDCALVTHFMETNGRYVLVYENSQEIRKNSSRILGLTSNLAARAEAAYNARDAQVDINAVKDKMVLIHRLPEDWTVEDLAKMKSHPKGAEVFKALVRVRNAIYDPEVPKEVKVQLLKNLLNAMPDGTATAKLRALLDRVQTVGGGRPSNQ
jgi:hypothetical protein